MKKVRKQNTNLTLDLKIKKKAILVARKQGQSLSALITFLLVKAISKTP